MALGIGMLGYGGIGKLHALAYRSIPGIYPSLPRYAMAAVCTSSRETADVAAREGGFERAYTDMRAIVADPNVNVIDVVLPNHAHKQAILLALDAGKHVYCEKPLALSGTEAREIAAAAARSKSRVGMTFDYRFVPALTKAKALIDAGALGEVYGFHSEYLHGGYQDASRPLTWRMRFESSGGGALVDLGSHVIDLIRWLLGEIAEVFAETKTYITERPLKKGASELGPVTVDDAAWTQFRMVSGAVGSLIVSRFATGSADDLRIRIEGSKGALRFDLMDANWLYFYDATRPAGAAGWVRLETISSFPGASVPPARAILGWERLHAENQYSFLKAIFEGRNPSPGLADGVANHLVIDALYSSATSGRWERVAGL
ncbi:MAG TPA: Gfo/Idh/MocA family oxidoreductase [Spirochaetia bacterium]|nr:Gfo/Idh/MocA family oxidoreductase [Spirochaetia bacterium]